MKLTIHTPDSAPEESRPVLAGIADDVGFVPNLAASVASSPTLLGAFDGLRRAVAASQPGPVEREVAGLAVAVAVDGAYGVAFHSTVLAGLGVDDTEIDKIRAGSPPSDDRLAAVYQLAREIVLTHGKVEDAAVSRLAELEFSAAEILDIVAECTFAGLVGVVDNLVGRVELDAFLAGRAWSS
jgi:alkylhydroperoxidase family enzyme